MNVKCQPSVRNILYNIPNYQGKISNFTFVEESLIKLVRYVLYIQKLI